MFVILVGEYLNTDVTDTTVLVVCIACDKCSLGFLYCTQTIYLHSNASSGQNLVLV